MGDDPRFEKVRKLLNLGEVKDDDVQRVREARNALSSAATILEGVVMEVRVPAAPPVAPPPAPPPVHVHVVDHGAVARAYEQGRQHERAAHAQAARRGGVPPVPAPRPPPRSPFWDREPAPAPAPRPWPEQMPWSPPPMPPQPSSAMTRPANLGYTGLAQQAPPHRCACGYQWFGSQPPAMAMHSCARCGTAG